MRITQVEIVAHRPRFRGGGYAMSYVVQEVLAARLIRLTTDTGITGVGEIVRRPMIDPAEAEPQEDRVLDPLTGMDMADLPALVAGWRVNPLLRGVAFAVELAFWDATARAAGLPLWALLGGRKSDAAPAYNSIGGKTPDSMAAAVRARPDHPVIQAKLGMGAIEDDLDRVRAVLAAMSPDQLLLADFNGALDRETALRHLPQIQDPRLIWEDPCAAYEDMDALARALEAPLMYDMCVQSLPEAVRALCDGVAGSLTIKPPFMGGLSVALTVRDMCEAAGMPMRIDGPWSGEIAAAADVHLALGAPEDLLITSGDLTDPLELTPTLVTHPAPGMVGVADGTGLGPIPAGLFP
ncbi:MAG: enolase C-terminal domain-like protein [Pseudomonadota bacterium]